MLVVVLGATFGLAACENAAPPVPQSVAIATVDHGAEAQRAVAARDWSAAASHFRAALANDPDNLALHYGLAISASWLDLLDEAAGEFKWVLAHATPGSDEARAAGDWLAAQPGPSATAAKADPKIGDAALHGVVTWEGPGHPYNVVSRAQLHLKGLPGTATKGLSYYMRTDKEGRYEFNRIVAGPYRLTDAVGATPRWSIKVEVKSGEDLELNLSAQNSTANRNDFAVAAGG